MDKEDITLPKGISYRLLEDF